jgi:hypothetical protein
MLLDSWLRTPWTISVVIRPESVPIMEKVLCIFCKKSRCNRQDLLVRHLLTMHRMELIGRNCIQCRRQFLSVCEYVNHLLQSPLHFHLQRGRVITPDDLSPYNIIEQDEAGDVGCADEEAESALSDAEAQSDAESQSESEIPHNESCDEFDLLDDATSDDEDVAVVDVDGGKDFLEYVQTLSPEQLSDLDWYCVIVRNYFTQKCQRDIGDSFKGQMIGIKKDKRTYARKATPLEKRLFPVSELKLIRLMHYL